jgi:hypothetical protein
MDWPGGSEEYMLPLYGAGCADVEEALAVLGKNVCCMPLQVWRKDSMLPSQKKTTDRDLKICHGCLLAVPANFRFIRLQRSIQTFHGAACRKANDFVPGKEVACNFPSEKLSMSYDNVGIILLALAIGTALICWLAFRAGRLHGYRAGLEKGTTLSSRLHHMQGLNDGYVMALQHTPGQRNEYMNNVLLRTGALSQQDIDTERRLRFRLQMEG